MRFLLIGFGSIGRRHAQILQDLDHEVVTIDPYNQDADHKSLDKVARLAFSGVLICTPANVRESVAQDVIKAGIKTQAWFVEKPLGDFQPRNEPVMVGFCYYWLPSLREYILGLEDYRIYHLTVRGGLYLQAWHDGPYIERYHGTAGGVGGVIIDSMPHNVFIARWIMGDLQPVGAVSGHLSGLWIETEDMAAALFRAEPGGQPVYVQADYLRDPEQFYIEAVTSDSVMEWELEDDEIHSMYLNQMRVFCKVAAGDLRYGFPNYDQGQKVEDLVRWMKAGEREEQRWL